MAVIGIVYQREGKRTLQEMAEAGKVWDLLLGFGVTIGANVGCGPRQTRGAR